ncbi:MAG: ABC transporter ATP-binding protein [Elusimicrobia bacterium]|nr:ABC transporter ATP-binding protein [Elusimicrobiota bacterium]MDE2314170.1 ABC transporter ATP-binding protein [Elusimicrobiota bacterium]
MTVPSVAIKGVGHVYPAKKKSPAREALKGVSLDVEAGEIFGVLGPNGGGKSTLFKILSTALKPTSGSAEVFGLDVLKDANSVRRRLGVVFQNPSLDVKLTVKENMEQQGRLYGVRGAELSRRIADGLERYGLASRANDYAGALSGGQKRRVELAKSLLHKPDLILLDEPSTGLDPGARRDLWTHMKDLRAAQGSTILLTTHYMDEAENCSRLALLDEGRLAAQGTPAALKAEIGGDVIAIESEDPAELGRGIKERFGVAPAQVDGVLRIERENGHAFIPQIVEAFPGAIKTVSLSKPTLEDVFMHRTGHRFWVKEEKEAA